MKVVRLSNTLEKMYAVLHYIYIYVIYIYIHIYIYIYIERERERERIIYICIYTYIYNFKWRLKQCFCCWYHSVARWESILKSTQVSEGESRYLTPTHISTQKNIHFFQYRPLTNTHLETHTSKQEHKHKQMHTHCTPLPHNCWTTSVGLLRYYYKADLCCWYIFSFWPLNMSSFPPQSIMLNCALARTLCTESRLLSSNSNTQQIPGRVLLPSNS